MVHMCDLKEEDDPREDHYAQTIAERESWLRSFGMFPYTTPDKFMAKMNRENIESRKVQVDDLPPCEKVPGVVTAEFKQHLEKLKEDCLTAVNWSGARNKVRHAIQQHKIDKMVVLGSASIFCHTSEYLFWQYEMAFILAIFEMAKQQAQNRNTRVPKLIFQDPAFCTADHHLLSGLGAQVVEDPLAFVLMDENTLVFAKHIPLVVYFRGLLQTSPAVCISTNLKQATEGAVYLQTKWSDFGPGFDVRRVADRFIAKRKTIDLNKVMLRLYNEIPGHELDNLLFNMAVMWLATEEEEKESLRKAKQMGSLGKKAKKWLNSL